MGGLKQWEVGAVVRIFLEKADQAGLDTPRLKKLQYSEKRSAVLFWRRVPATCVQLRRLIAMPVLFFYMERCILI